MVAGVIHISDEFELDGGGNKGDDGAPFAASGGDFIVPGGDFSGSGVDYEKSGERESCMNTLAAALGAAVFLLIQVHAVSLHIRKS